MEWNKRFFWFCKYRPLSYFNLAANKLIKKGVAMAMAICICNFCNGNGMKVPFARNLGTSTPLQIIGIANAAGLCFFFQLFVTITVCKGTKSCVCRYYSVATIWESRVLRIMLLRIVRIPMRLNKGYSPIVSLQ